MGRKTPPNMRQRFTVDLQFDGNMRAIPKPATAKALLQGILDAKSYKPGTGIPSSGLVSAKVSYPRRKTK